MCLYVQNGLPEKTKQLTLDILGKKKTGKWQENTIILKINLMDCALFSHGTRYEINFH